MISFQTLVPGLVLYAEPADLAVGTAELHEFGDKSLAVLLRLPNLHVTIISLDEADRLVEAGHLPVGLQKVWRPNG